jgi:hypothetical protein
MNISGLALSYSTWLFNYMSRVTWVNVDADFITSIMVSQIGQAVIPGIIYVKTFSTDVDADFITSIMVSCDTRDNLCLRHSVLMLM